MIAASHHGIRGEVRWQAHQSTNAEMPENTMSAMRYAWEMGGIPELDIRQTADGVIIGLHDPTAERTTNAPEGMRNSTVAELTFKQIREWDAGVKFGEAFRDERVPSLEEVLAVLASHPERELYLDYKQVNLEELAALIKQYGVARQIIFAHRNHENCRIVKRLAPEVRTMMWIPGRLPDETASVFQAAADSGFDSLDIIQIHLVDADDQTCWPYRVQRDYLEAAIRQLTAAGLELEVLPFHFDQDSLFSLLDMGIRRFAVDEPQVFIQTLDRY